MPITMPRVAPGQIITSESYNALAAEIEALGRRLDQLSPGAPVPDDPIPTPKPPVIDSIDAGDGPNGDQREAHVTTLRGKNFGSPADYAVWLERDGVASLVTNFEPGSSDTVVRFMMPQLARKPLEGDPIPIKLTLMTNFAQAAIKVWKP
jgi:hypothetical protein